MLTGPYIFRALYQAHTRFAYERLVIIAGQIDVHVASCRTSWRWYDFEYKNDGNITPANGDMTTTKMATSSSCAVRSTDTYLVHGRE